MAALAAVALRLIVLQNFKTINWRKEICQCKVLYSLAGRLSENSVLGAAPQARYGSRLLSSEVHSLHGMLMEVTPEKYAEFYRIQNRQRYMDRRSVENRDISVDVLTTEEFNGADILVDPGESIDELVIHKMRTEQMFDCLLLLEEEEQHLIRDLFCDGRTEQDAAKKYGVSQAAIHKRKRQILSKLIRPVLCIQNNAGNKHSPTIIVAAITSRETRASFPTHVSISTGGLRKKSYVLLEQIRTIDKTRLGEYVGKISKDEMGRVDHAIIVSMGLKYMENLL